MGVFQKLLHAGEGKRLKAVQAIVPLVSAFEPEVEKLSDEQLIARTGEFKGRVDRAKSGARNPDHELELINDALDDLLPEAFATVREAGKRVLGQRHFDVQVMGGAALHLGWVAEMKTGEGKTLVATLPCYLNALVGPRRAPHHGQRLPRPLPGRVDGPAAQLPRPEGRHDHPRQLHARREAPAVRLRRHVRHEQRVRLRLPPRQHGRAPRAAGAAG